MGTEPDIHGPDGDQRRWDTPSPRYSRPAYRTNGDQHGTGGSFASYAELADDRDALTERLGTVKADLALALAALDRYITTAPCLPIDPAVAEAAEGRCTPPLPAGSCLAHWHYATTPCPIGEAQALLARHGVR